MMLLVIKIMLKVEETMYKVDLIPFKDHKMEFGEEGIPLMESTIKFKDIQMMLMV